MRTLLIITALILSANITDAGERLDRTKYKAFWKVPLSSHDEVSWTSFEVLECDSATKKCDKLVRRIPASQLRMRGSLSMDRDLKGTLQLIYTDANDPNRKINLTSIAFKNEWYPRTELCQWSRIRANCDYTIEIDPKTSNLQLNIFYLN